MENKQQLLHRLAALLVMLLLCAGLAGSRLVDLQLVHGQEYLERSAQFLTTTSTVSAARGEILDRYGRPMVSNKTGCGRSECDGRREQNACGGKKAGAACAG